MSKKDDDDGFIPFAGIEKGSVLIESRTFNETPLSARKCAAVLTKLLYVLSQGDGLSRAEATGFFFDTTKLFQSQDPMLRRMVYLIIRELSKHADQAFIVINSLCKDINSNNEMYQSNAIRALRAVADTSMLGPVERYLKQAIVDKNGSVSSSALVSGLHLFRTAPDLVKRWGNEAQEALNNKSPMAQYHALALLYRLRGHDRLAVSKLVSQSIHSSIRSPLAQCLLIKYTARVLSEDSSSGTRDRALFEFLESCLRNKSEMVIFEAARAICALPNVTPKELSSAVTVLQLFLNSPKPTMRFAAVRILNKVAATHELVVATCNLDMESLIGDSNRSIATLAITTLLKTGSEATIERLMKQISSFMSEIADEFKIVVVESMRALCIKYPSKCRVLLTFLSNALREEGGFEFKKSIVDAIITITDKMPDSKEVGLSHLCEFIEDCEFALLSQKVLHLLGEEGPKTSTPSKYIRYIYNRVILESASVRASSVSALAKFGSAVESLRPSIIVLLKRCLQDNDDEVRDRAVFALNLLQSQQPAAVKDLVASGAEKFRKDRAESASASSASSSSAAGAHGGVSAAAKAAAAKADSAALAASASSSSSSSVSPYDQIFASHPDLAKLGPVLRSSKPVELTEAGIEYAVNVVKHLLPRHLVLQFNINNTVEDLLLENVTVATNASDAEGLVPAFVIPAKSVPFQSSEQCFVAFSRPQEAGVFPAGSISCTLQFIVKTVDAKTGKPSADGDEDEYQIEEVDVALADYVQRHTPNFKKEWDEFGADHETRETFSLGSMKTIQAAAVAIVDFLGMTPYDNTENVPSKAKTHTLLLAGKLSGVDRVLATASLFYDASQTVTMELAVRAESEETRALITGSIA